MTDHIDVVGEPKSGVRRFDVYRMSTHARELRHCMTIWASELGDAEMQLARRASTMHPGRYVIEDWERTLLVEPQPSIGKWERHARHN
jgi:hypothetical protein